MKRYIRSSTSHDSIEVEYADSPTYTGGNIWNFTGKLKNGNYFVASDANCDLVELNEDPNIFINSDDPDSDNIWVSDWFNDHNIKEDYTEEEEREFWSSLISWLIDNADWHEYTVKDLLKYMYGFEDSESDDDEDDEEDEAHYYD